jgi:hypothetical protein
MKLIRKIGLSLVVALISFASMNAQEAKVTDAQIDKFAELYQTITAENMKAQQNMMAIIEDEGLTMERFNEIHTASLDPNAKSDASDSEKKKHKSALTKIEETNEKVQNMLEAKIKEAGMTIEEFQELGQKIQSSPELNAKLMAKFQ